MDWGSSRKRTMSETINRPLGDRTLKASSKTRFLFGDRLITQFEIMTSTELSAAGRFSISPSLNSTFVYFPFLAFALALSIISGVMSTPITLPLLPTLLAAKKQSKPAPAPKSRTVSPSFSDAIAVGLHSQDPDLP